MEKDRIQEELINEMAAKAIKQNSKDWDRLFK